MHSAPKVSIQEALASFGWDLTDEFMVRYYDDALVYNVVNALRLTLGRIRELEDDDEKTEREIWWQIIKARHKDLPEQLSLMSGLPPRPWEAVRVAPRYL